MYNVHHSLFKAPFGSFLQDVGSHFTKCDNVEEEIP